MEDLAWEQDPHDPASVTVRFRGSAEHARLWQLFQARGFGVAAVAVAPPLASGSCSTTSELPPPQAASERTRVLSLPETFYLLATTQWLASPAARSFYAEIWDRFSSATPQLHFQRHYVAQFHLRELGWTLRSGLNYGGHYVLYRGATNEFHSEYIVYVKDEATPLSWGVLQALTRVAADVKKTVLVCDIAHEEDHHTVGEGNDAVMSSSGTNSLTEGEYEFFGHRFRFSAIAIRFWDVTAADAQSSSSGEQQTWTCDFQPQPMLLKKQKKARRKEANKVPKQQKMTR